MKRQGRTGTLMVVHSTRERRGSAFRRGSVGTRGISRRQIKDLSYDRGFTLLEVMLALAILAGALAVLGELGRSGMRSAKSARDSTRAQLLAESIMNDIIAGIISPAEPVQDSPVPDPVQGTATGIVSDDDIARWVYSIDPETIDQDGLLEVAVTVKQDLPDAQRPASFTLVRWVPDPGVGSTDTSMPETQ
jgi:prepilin-type N-terminal cleavage/methylation domain-containing protein